MQNQRIALLADRFIYWAGGVDFLRQCITALNSVVPDMTWPVLVPKPMLPQRLLAFAVTTKRKIWSLGGVRPPFDKPLSENQLKDALASTTCKFEILSYPGNSKGVCEALSKLDAQVVLPCYRSLGKAFPHKWIGYYADLQHKRLPDNFSKRERWKRDMEAKAILADASAMIVLSRNAVRDIETFYPRSKAALFVLPFCPLANAEFLTDIADDELSAYDLQETFFIISNQFWVHKSHETAFAALRLLREAGFHNVHIVCTGNTHDFRKPHYFDRLKQDVTRDGLSDRIRFLGMIPKRHQMAIMRRSVALLQPTLFEGAPGGLSVCDAVSTATPAIVTVIEVNQEADLGVLQFFRAGSAEDLAQKMIAALKTPPQRMSTEATLAMLRQRQKELGAKLLEAISFVAGESTGAVR